MKFFNYVSFDEQIIVLKSYLKMNAKNLIKVGVYRKLTNFANQVALDSENNNWDNVFIGLANLSLFSYKQHPELSNILNFIFWETYSKLLSSQQLMIKALLKLITKYNSLLPLTDVLKKIENCDFEYYSRIKKIILFFWQYGTIVAKELNKITYDDYLQMPCANFIFENIGSTNLNWFIELYIRYHELSLQPYKLSYIHKLDPLKEYIVTDIFLENESLLSSCISTLIEKYSVDTSWASFFLKAMENKKEPLFQKQIQAIKDYIDFAQNHLRKLYANEKTNTSPRSANLIM